MKTYKYNLLWVTIFAIFMAYLESSVVVYLREIYFPEGFEFPIKIMPLRLALVELGREGATIFMLLSVAFLGSKKRWSRFGYFMISFGVWDIWYYIWLKIMLDWPPSLLTWDLLFLIPVPWVGPVLAPVIVSISLIIAGITIIYLEDNGYRLKIYKHEWILVIAGGIIIFISFITEATTVMKLEVPLHYHWWLFIPGEIIGFVIFINAVFRILKHGK